MIFPHRIFTPSYIISHLEETRTKHREQFGNWGHSKPERNEAFFKENGIRFHPRGLIVEDEFILFAKLKYGI